MLAHIINKSINGRKKESAYQPKEKHLEEVCEKGLANINVKKASEYDQERLQLLTNSQHYEKETHHTFRLIFIKAKQPVTLSLPRHFEEQDDC